MQRWSCRVRCMKQLDRRWKVLLVTAVAVFMAFLDVTIVNVAFPSIRAAFPSSSLAGAVVGAERLQHRLRGAAGAGRAAGGPAGAAAGVLLAGSALFMVASALCGLAPSVEVLVAARVLQAAGAALLVPTSLGLLLPEFPPERRASATALWGAVGGVAAATGPSLGGLLIEWGGLAARVLREPRAGRGWRGFRRGGCCARRATRTAAPCRTRWGSRCWRAASGCCRWRSSRRRTGAGGARGCWARSWSPRSLLVGLRVALDGASRTRCSSCRCSACARSRSACVGRVRVRAGLLRRAAGEHPVPDRRSGATRRCRPGSRSRPGR